jgi:hypothetical protein
MVVMVAMMVVVVTLSVVVVVVVVMAMAHNLFRMEVELRTWYSCFSQLSRHCWLNQTVFFIFRLTKLEKVGRKEGRKARRVEGRKEIRMYGMKEGRKE